MVPCLWLWAPQIHFPWSGSVAQNIEPSASWFSDLIKPAAGNPQIEAKAFGIASYGKQLGLITEVLIELSESTAAMTPQAAKSLRRLKQIKADIDAMKLVEYDAAAASLAAQVEAAGRRGGAEYESLVRRLLPLLKLPAA